MSTGYLLLEFIFLEFLDDVFAIARARVTHFMGRKTMSDDVRAIARARVTHFMGRQTMSDDVRAIVRARVTSLSLMTVLGFYP